MLICDQTPDVGLISCHEADQDLQLLPQEHHEELKASISMYVMPVYELVSRVEKEMFKTSVALSSPHRIRNVLW